LWCGKRICVKGLNTAQTDSDVEKCD
jgi:hypothetical protein